MKPAVLVQVSGGVAEDVMGCELVKIRDFDNGQSDFTKAEIAAARDATRLYLAAPALLAACQREAARHPAVQHGLCTICDHYGTDCEGHALRDAIAATGGSS